MKNTIRSLALAMVLGSGMIACGPEIYEGDNGLTEAIRLNQLGFYPEAPKKAVLFNMAESAQFLLVKDSDNQIVFQGKLSDIRSSSFSDRKTQIADFSAFSDTGDFRLVIPQVGSSYPFSINPKVHRELAIAAVKAFYFQRMSTELLPEHAGEWARPAGHPDDQVRVHASAATTHRPEGTIISAPKGWYDAGDYNKYIVNSGITMATLLALFEDFPTFTSGLNTEIPESGNEIPDLMDEVLWNLEWMFEMQDPHDGGVYHKLTTANFEGRVMPHEAINQRYVVAKGTAATLDFSAVMAQASRIFQEFRPDLAKKCLESSERAWEWALANPEVLYRQNEMNQAFLPEVNTGAYGDGNVDDEWHWAASELYISTQKSTYLDKVNLNPTEFRLPNWGSVGWLGYYSLLRFQDALDNFPDGKMEGIKKVLIHRMDAYLEYADEESPYHVVMGQDVKDFVWGSNAVAANQGVGLIQAYLLTENKAYLHKALANLDYIMGRNATGYSYVTGYGHKTPMNPHHRPSGADAVRPPVPGLMVGGPNPGQQDNCDYDSKLPDESYVDDYCSYASNEIAINWSAPFAYLSVAMEAIMD